MQIQHLKKVVCFVPAGAGSSMVSFAIEKKHALV